MEIKTSDLKELRERTAAGMMDCKKALEENNGDMEKAIEWLREKGAVKAAKKSARIAAEGLIGIKIDGNKAAIVEVNSETDFVTKNADFINYVDEVAVNALNTSSASLEDFLNSKWNAGENTVAEVLTDKVATIGEKITIRRFEKLEEPNGVIVSYVHNAGKIGVLVDLETDKVTDDTKEVGKNVAMQIAAINPLYLTRDMIEEDYIAKEKEIIIAQLKEENKPQDIIEKMMEGKLTKQLKEVCLMDQSYVKDPSMTVEKYIEDAAKKIGANIKIKRFIRYEAGEGIEKREENFAEEVAKQMNINS